jgi:hypothetical protein
MPASPNQPPTARDRRLTKGLATSRAQSMKSCATGLIVLSFSVTIAIANGAISSSIGSFLTANRLAKKWSNTDSG